MPTISFNLIGAGRLGKSLAFSLLNSKLCQLETLCNSTLASAQAATTLLKTGVPTTSPTALRTANMLWITVPDDQIANIVKELAEKQTLKPGTIVIHCSGSLSASILSPLATQGCYTASLHPLKVFPKDAPLNSNVFRNCYCVLEGAPQAINIIEPLFKALGAILFNIHPEKKAVYHLAAVIASNYLVTLAATGAKLFEKAGIDESLAKLIVQALMQGSLNAVKKSDSPKDALTGPLARGDTQTIKRHLEVLNDIDVRQFYCAAALTTLPLTQLDVTQQEKIQDLLNNQTANML